MGASIDFDGVTDRYDSDANFTALNGATTASFCFWINFNDISGTQVHLSSWTTSGNRKWLIWSNGTYFIFDISDNTSVREERTTSDFTTLGISAGNWYHVAMIYKTATDLDIYIDGVSVSTTVTANNSIASIGSTNDIMSIADRSGTPGVSSNAKLAYIHIYDKALSAEEINEVLYKPESIVDNLQMYVPLYMSVDNVKDLAGGQTFTKNGDPTSSADGPSAYFPNLKIG